MGFKELDHVAENIARTSRVPQSYVSYSSFDGLMSYDKRQRTLLDNEGVQIYIEKQNEVGSRLDNVLHTWHMQESGKLSKKFPWRVSKVAETLIKDFSTQSL